MYSRFIKLTVSSLDPVARYLPLGENVTFHTCPLIKHYYVYICGLINIFLFIVFTRMNIIQFRDTFFGWYIYKIH